MKLYLAPMEALTGYIFRNVYNRYFEMLTDILHRLLQAENLTAKKKMTCCLNTIRIWT